jgi:hypothetical protein
MAAPVVAVGVMVLGVVFFVVGFLSLPACSNDALVFFGLGVLCLGIGGALFGGVFVLYPTALFAALLVILGVAVVHGAAGCAF